MDARLVNFLSTRTVSKNEPFTHTSKISPCRRFYIAPEDLDEFYDTYNTVVAEKGIAGITEKPEEVCPLIVDIDFRYPHKKVRTGDDVEPKRLYTRKHVEGIVQIYQEIISEIAEKVTPKMLICCVLEKISPVFYQGAVKDGLHLHFPNFFAEQKIH